MLLCNLEVPVLRGGFGKGISTDRGVFWIVLDAQRKSGRQGSAYSPRGCQFPQGIMVCFDFALS